VAPYLWVADVKAEGSLPPIGADTSPSVQKFDTRITGGLMLAAEARYRAVGVLMDFNWLQLDTQSLNPGKLYSGVDLRSDYSYTTAALTYTLPFRGKFQAEIVGGARVWHVATDFTLHAGLLPGAESSSSETWVSPLVGADLSYDLSRHWRLLARGTVGGFTSSNVQWDAFGGVGYQFSHWCVATLGYRYLHEEYNHGSFTFNADAQGPLLGVVFRF
jgi:opacity protein-like surface antigen